MISYLLIAPVCFFPLNISKISPTQGLHPVDIYANIMFNEPISRRTLAVSEFFLMIKANNSWDSLQRYQADFYVSGIVSKEIFSYAQKFQYF